MSKAIATLVTQPLIVAKVGLQSRPPPARQGKPFESFIEVMKYIVDHEGPLALFKGLSPQITKGVLVQGLLMMTKERCVLCHSNWEIGLLTLFEQDGGSVHCLVRLSSQSQIGEDPETC